MLPLRNDWKDDAKLAIHVFLIAVLWGVGIALALPADTFGSSRSFSVMARIGTEDGWAMTLWLAGCFGFIGLFTPSRVLRMVSVLVLATMHGIFALFLGASGNVNTGTLTYGFIALLGYYLAWRRTREGV
jgi:hypothetical protein